MMNNNINIVTHTELVIQPNMISNFLIPIPNILPEESSPIDHHGSTIAKLCLIVFLPSRITQLSRIEEKKPTAPTVTCTVPSSTRCSWYTGQLLSYDEIMTLQPDTVVSDEMVHHDLCHALTVCISAHKTISIKIVNEKYLGYSIIIINVHTCTDTPYALYDSKSTCRYYSHTLYNIMTRAYVIILAYLCRDRVRY